MKIGVLGVFLALLVAFPVQAARVTPNLHLKSTGQPEADRNFEVIDGLARVADMGGQVYNVKAARFGAKADATSDDTSAILAAITAASVSEGGIVYFPPGWYKTTGVTITDKRVSLVGAGGGQEDIGAQTVNLSGASVLFSTTNAPIVKYTIADRSNPKGQFATIQGLELRGSTTAGTGQHCLQIDNRGLILHDVSVQQCGGHGIYYTDSVGTVGTAVRAWETNLDGFHMDDTISGGAAAVTQNTCVGCVSIANARDGFRCAKGGSGNVFVGFLTQSNTGLGLNFIGGSPSNLCRFNRFVGAWDELNVGGTVKFDASGSQDNAIEYVRYASGAPNFDSGWANQNTVSGVNFGSGAPGNTAALNTAIGGFLVCQNASSLCTLRERDNNGLGKLLLGEQFFTGTTTSDTSLYGCGTAKLCLTNGGQVAGTADLSLRRLLPAQAVVTFGASIALDTSLGDTFTIALTGALTWTAWNNAVTGHRITVIATQDATGSRQMTMPANVKLAGGAYTASGANKVDTLSFVFTGTNWYETGRALNE